MCFLISRNRPDSPSVSRGHHRAQTTAHDILLSVGFKYACCRQFIFIANALLIGCSMALIAAGVKERDSPIGQVLGSSWYQIIALAVSILLTTVLGCTGACYQKRYALYLYIVVLVLLIIAEGAIIFIASSSELDEVLEREWNTLNERTQTDIAETLNCDTIEDGSTSDLASPLTSISTSLPPMVSIVYDPADCIKQLIKLAKDSRRLVMGVCGAIIGYQVLMMASTVFYLKGLGQKQERLKELTNDSKSEDKVVAGLEIIDSSDYKNIKRL